ncbi:hypothetical protein CEXT_676061 [Caerostris extrusa]|uniref:Uncharacterized protein n=1 Tax=Caerostris extrusa TaxID=172846 RepID=A0AAV4PWJ8_CAEEX|nr:hypothetical protein CEXT_676061 [Caerostris extrusa]
MASGTDVTGLSASDLWSQQLPDFGWCYLQVTRQVSLLEKIDSPSLNPIHLQKVLIEFRRFLSLEFQECILFASLFIKVLCHGFRAFEATRTEFRCLRIQRAILCAFAP